MEIKRTLKLAGTEMERVWEMLGENAVTYSNNGGAPDGNAWLPSVPLDESDEGVQEVLDADLGEMVKAVYSDLREFERGMAYDGIRVNEEVERWLAEAETEEIYQHAQGVLNSTSEGWAGYLNGDVLVYESF